MRNTAVRVFECYEISRFIQKKLFEHTGNIGEAFVPLVDDISVSHDWKPLNIKNL